MATGEVAMAYTRAAMERAMKVADVLLHALKERQPWIHVAEVLGVSPRTVRRLRWRYEHHGFEGLFDHRHLRPSPRCAPLAEVQRVLGLYRDQATIPEGSGVWSNCGDRGRGPAPSAPRGLTGRPAWCATLAPAAGTTQVRPRIRTP